VANVGVLTVVRDINGDLRCDDPIPNLVSFSPELVAELRGGSSQWCSVDGDTIVMRVCPEPLYFRLTGEVDLSDGLVAQRMTADGRVWP
jgi:hypothetical protein